MRLTQRDFVVYMVFPTMVIVLGALIWAWLRESPCLEVAGPIRAVRGVVEIPLRTRSDIPVVVFGYWIRISPLVGAKLSDEKPIRIDTDTLPPNRWVWKVIEPFQVKREDVSKLPISIRYLNNNRPISVDILLGYGDPENPKLLPIASLKVNQNG